MKNERFRSATFTGFSLRRVDMEYLLSVWKGVYDNAVKVVGPGDWQWIVQQLEKAEQTDDKHSVPLFNLTRFDAVAKGTGQIVEDKVMGGTASRRVGENIVEITGLLIDYDNDSLLQEAWTMDAVAERFKEYTYLMYSSHSYWKNHPAVERFRLVLPFSKAMTITTLADDWHPYVPAIKKFIGYEDPKNLPEEMQYPDETTGQIINRDKPAIDKQSFNPVQGYYLPSCPVGKNVVHRRNDGKFLDLSQFEKAERKVAAQVPVSIPAKAVRGGTGNLIYESFDVLRWIQENGLYISRWRQENIRSSVRGATSIPRRRSRVPCCCHPCRVGFLTSTASITTMSVLGNSSRRKETKPSARTV